MKIRIGNSTETASIYRKVQLTHNNAVIKPECLYAGECLNMLRNGKLGEIEKKERKITQIILGFEHIH